MKRGVIIFLALALCVGSAVAREPFVNEICLPSKQYLMEGVANEFNSPSFTKRWRPYNDYIRYGGSVEYSKGCRLEKMAIIDKPRTGDTLEVALINGDHFDTLSLCQSVIYAATPAVGEKRVVVQFLGDSFTRGTYFKNAFLEAGYVPNVKLVGSRVVSDFPEHGHEGRGGWSLFDYYSLRHGEHIHNPFYQPEGEYRYWGSTDFWANAVKVKANPKGGSFDLRYNCGDYNTERFGEDGYLLNPKRGDVLYDSQAECYRQWQRGAWREVELSGEWDFDYGKYLDMWELDAPEFLVIYLGLNDFKHLELPADFTLWNSLMERALLSYRSAVPSGKLLLSTPCSACGTHDSENANFSAKQNAVMWELRRNIIETFDGREDEGIYVVDSSVVLDNESSYNFNKDGLQVGNPHPYPSYPKLGVPAAAFVQYYRDR